MNRWKAAFTHLLISLTVVGSVAGYIICFWYPIPLIPMARADRLLELIAGVDLIVGPLLTLLVYKPGKPSLRFDLTVIGLLQAVFLGFGLHSVYDSRPVFLVAVPDRFELVFANEIDPGRLSQAKNPKFRTLGYGKPVLLGVEFPRSNKDEMQAILMSAVTGSGDIQMMPKYYVDYAKAAPELLKHAQPLTAASGRSADAVTAMVAAAKHYGRKPEELRFVPIASSRGYATMLIDAKTGALTGPVNADL